MQSLSITIPSVYNGIKVTEVVTNTVSRCECFCGTFFEAKNYLIIKGSVKSCGCLRTPDLIGRYFSKLFVLSKSNKKDSSNGILWDCRCSCGNIILVSTTSLRSGNTKSCGCLTKDNLKAYRASLKKDPDIPLTIHAQRLRDNFKKSGLSKLVLERDNFTCQLCKTPGGVLNAHHIISSFSDESLLLEETNLITLCRACHYIAHDKGNWKTVNKEIQAELQYRIKDKLNIVLENELI